MSSPNHIPPRNLRETPRRETSPGGSDEGENVLALQFRGFVSLARELLGDPRLAQSSLLRQAEGEIRGYSKRICRALSVAENPRSDQPVSGYWIQDMLEEGELFLEQIQQQLHWQTQVIRQAKELHPLTDVLLKQGAGASEQICYDNFAQIVTSVLRRNPLSGWNFETYPLARISSDILSHQGEDPLVADSTVQGILSCWSVVRLAKSLWLHDDQILPLGVSALLQDLGLQALRTARSQPGEFPHEEFPTSHPDRFLQHPTIGAAIVAGLSDVPPLVPNLIAQHHERINGAGSPRGCSASDLSKPSRLLAMVVRLEELRHEQNSLEQLAEWSSANLAPSERLQQETLQGLFDADLLGLFGRRELVPRQTQSSIYSDPNRRYLLDPPHAASQRHSPPEGSDVASQPFSRNRFLTD